MGKDKTAGSAGTGLELKYKVYRQNGEIVVDHANGYYGTLYGKKSLAIFYGTREVLHTAHRAINTAEELAEMLETMPAFLRLIGAIPDEEGEGQCED